MDEDTRVAIAVLQANAKNTDSNLVRLEGKVDAGFAELKADMKSGLQRLDDKMDTIKDESKKDLKWIIGMFGASVLFLAGLMYFLFGRISIPTAAPQTKSAVSSPAQAPTPSSSSVAGRDGKK